MEVNMKKIHKLFLVSVLFAVLPLALILTGCGKTNPRKITFIFENSSDWADMFIKESFSDYTNEIVDGNHVITINDKESITLGINITDSATNTYYVPDESVTVKSNETTIPTKIENNSIIFTLDKITENKTVVIANAKPAEETIQIISDGYSNNTVNEFMKNNIALNTTTGWNKLSSLENLTRLKTVDPNVDFKQFADDAYQNMSVKLYAGNTLLSDTLYNQNNIYTTQCTKQRNEFEGPLTLKFDFSQLTLTHFYINTQMSGIVVTNGITIAQETTLQLKINSALTELDYSNMELWLNDTQLTKSELPDAFGFPMFIFPAQLSPKLLGMNSTYDVTIKNVDFSSIVSDLIKLNASLPNNFEIETPFIMYNNNKYYQSSTQFNLKAEYKSNAPMLNLPIEIANTDTNISFNIFAYVTQENLVDSTIDNTYEYKFYYIAKSLEFNQGIPDLTIDNNLPVNYLSIEQSKNFDNYSYTIKICFTIETSLTNNILSITV